MRTPRQFRQTLFTVFLVWSAGCVHGIVQDSATDEDGNPNNPHVGNGGSRSTGGGPGSGGGPTNPNGNGASGGTDPTGTGGDPTGSGGTGGGTVTDCSKSILDNFEMSGSGWYAWKDASSPGKLTMKREAPGRDGGLALHSTADNIKAALASIQLNWAALPKTRACPDFSASTGLRFWAKGDQLVRVAAMVSGILPPENGGTCSNKDACWAAHGYDLNLTGEWKEFVIPWEEFTQKNPLVATPFDKTQIKQITFTNTKDGPWDFWLDDLKLESTAIDGPNDKGEPTCTVGKYMNASTFNSWFPERNALYEFDGGLCEAIKRYWNKFTYKFANTGDANKDKREIAAFFAHVKKETYYLKYTTEQNLALAPWHGRGPLQLSHQDNYRAAATALGDSRIASNPDIVATDRVVTWGVALWFWITERGAGTMTCHDAMTTGEGSFVETSKTINGAVEGCSGPSPEERARYYRDFCQAIGVTQGSGAQTC